MATNLLGIDIGTSSCKALLVSERGEVLAEASAAYPVDMPRSGWSEQNPDDWWRGVRESVSRLIEKARIDGGQVGAIGLSGQMHGLVLLDAAGRSLRPCILWNDQRSAPQCAEITQRIGLEQLLATTGNPVLPGFTAPKLEWVRRHEPDMFARIAHVLLPKDYVRYRMSGVCVGDVSDCSGTSWFDVGSRCWSQIVLDELRVPMAWMPEVVESQAVCARLSADAAADLGLRAGTPIVGGAGDQAAQAVGSGIVEEGLLSATLGTSGVVFASTRRFAPEPHGRLHAFCHARPDLWHWMGVMLSAGGSLEWLGSLFAAGVEQESAIAAGLADAARVPAGAEGLLFLPYLTGERTPHPDPDARGVFFGLSPRHTRGHLFRAVLEGVAFGLRDSLELLRSCGATANAVRVSGGGARSALWRQILADVFQLPLVTVNAQHGAAYGAALLAGVGVGAFVDVHDACRRSVREAERLEPSDAVGIYDRSYTQYRALYPALAPRFAAAARDAESRTG